MFCHICSREKNLTIPFFLISVFLEDLNNPDNQRFKNFLNQVLLCSSKKQGFTEANRQLLNLTATSLENSVPPVSHEDIFQIRDLVNQGEIFNENNNLNDLGFGQYRWFKHVCFECFLRKFRQVCSDIEKKKPYQRKDDYFDGGGGSSYIVSYAFLPQILQHHSQQLSDLKKLNNSLLKSFVSISIQSQKNFLLSQARVREEVRKEGEARKKMQKRIENFELQFQQIIILNTHKTSVLNQIENSCWNYFYADWQKENIKRAKSIEEVNNLASWPGNLWVKGSRQQKITLFLIVLTISTVWFSIWKWNLIKKYKDWYNDPGELDETEKEWYKLMEEEEEDI